MISFYSKTNFTLQKKRIIKNWIKKVILSEKKELGEITYVFCDDRYLLKKNLDHLHHDTLTDIITFDYSKENTLTADIIISIERVKENSIIFESSFYEELNRVMIHGVLHLIGYNDKTKNEKKKMREKEDFYLKKIFNHL